MRVECPNCGGAHPAWDCKRPATKSTAAQKVVLEVQATPKEPRQGRVSLEPKKSRTRMASDVRSVKAGTQALPVDTNSNPVQDAKALTANTEATVAPEPAQGVQIPRPGPPTKRPRGRPRIHPDRKAYKAQWERDKRKRMKEGVKD